MMVMIRMERVMGKKWYQDDSYVEHGCCWDHAIVRKCKRGEGQYGEGVELLAEVTDQETVDLILKAVAKADEE